MKNAIIFDGAFGTYIAREKPQLDFPEMANITEPNLVLNIHKEYISSGVDAVKTNTFAANSGLTSDFVVLKNIIKNGFDLANQAVLGTDVKVFADIGPIFGDNSSNEYQQIADIFIECGSANFLFETLSEVKSLQNTIANIKSRLPDAVIMTSFAVSQDGYTNSGEYYETLLDEAQSYGADYVGLNCICGPSHMLNLIKKLPPDKYNLSAMPNAGYPAIVNGRTVYIDNPDYYSEKLFEIYSYGVKVIGGCCGTTPEHIARLKERVYACKPQSIKEGGKQAYKKAEAKNSFSKTTPIIAVEINSPLDSDAEFILDGAKRVKEFGADFITIPDSPLGKARANSFMISALIKRVAGIDVIPHLCCRDKNQIAVKGDLIAANIEEISNILAVTGDPIAEVFRGDAKHVFGLNSFKLIGFIKNLNDTVFSENPYNICAALNTTAENFDAELKRAEKKIEEGANCFFTQPIFTQKNIDNFLKAKKTLNCKVMAGIMPLAGYKNALFLNNEVPGIEIPDETVRKFEDKNPQETKEISINYALSIIERIKENCDGYYIMTPLKKIDFSIELIKHIRGLT